MKNALKLMAVSAIVLMISAPAAFAQSQEVSTLAITEPTDVGGTILQPGTYLVRVVSPQADRNKVQITSIDRDKVYATVLTIPHQLEPNEEIPNSTFVYFPAESGRARTLRTWFSTNPVTGGHDFVYDQTRATQLAKVSNEPVYSYRSEPTVAEYNVVAPDATVEEYEWPAPAPVQTTEVTTTTVTTPAPVQTEVTTLTTPAPEPTPAPVMEDTTPAPMASSAPEETMPEMPQTASRTPLLALLGVMALVAAVAVRMARS
jgi:hypothetical protein